MKLSQTREDARHPVNDHSEGPAWGPGRGERGPAWGPERGESGALRGVLGEERAGRGKAGELPGQPGA